MEYLGGIELLVPSKVFSVCVLDRVGVDFYGVPAVRDVHVQGREDCLRLDGEHVGGSCCQARVEPFVQEPS